MHQWVKVCYIGGMYIALSAGLISFNKYLMHADRFPFASVIVLLHMIGSTVFASILRVTCPWLFPSLTDPSKRVEIGWSLMLKNIVPIATLFSLQLVLSNSAYSHSTVAFLQMMKEANIVLVYLLSLFVMLETFRWRNLGILVFIVMSTIMCVHGEMQFSMRGLLLQGSSQFAESLKIVLQALILSGNSKLDAMSYVLLVAPVSAVSLVGIGAIQYLFVPSVSIIEAWPKLAEWMPFLALNILVAFSLNVVIALFIKNTSGVAFILAGVAKDVMIVIAGALFFHENVSMMQTVGFSMQLCGVFTWSLVKTFPEKFKDGLLPGFASIFRASDVAAAQKESAKYGATQA